MRKSFCLFAGGVASVMSLVFLAGCISDDPGSSSMAYVNITLHDAAAIRKMAVRVFGDDNYQLVSESAGSMVFEREATQRDRVLYGRYNEQLSMRVVVAIGPRRQGGYIVRADAYALRSGGVEDKLLRMGRRPYQDLLNRVKASLVTSGDH